MNDNNYPNSSMESTSVEDANTTGISNEASRIEESYASVQDTADTLSTLDDAAGMSLPSLRSTFSMVHLSMSMWSPKMPDEKAKAKLREIYGADDKSIEAKKALLAYCGELKTVKQHQESARSLHYRDTKPWIDGGFRLIRNERLWNWMGDMSQKDQEIEVVLQKFFDGYYDAVQNDQLRLGSLYKKKDYPSLREVKTKFAFVYGFEAVASDYMQPMFEEQKTALDEHYQKQYKQRMQGLTQKLWANLREQLLRVGKQKIYDGMADDVRAAVDALALYNVDNDPEMTRIYNELRGIINHDFNEEKMRRGESYRKQTQEQVQKVLDSLPSLSI
jgi:hypothetical protein